MKHKLRIAILLSVAISALAIPDSAFAKSAKGKQGHSVPHKQVKQEPDAKTQQQLTQLKQQLQSGLITKEEYQEKRNALLEK